MPAAASVPSPCVRLCTLDGSDVCVGCGRTIDEITGWTAMTDAEQRDVVGRAAVRLGERRRR